MNTYLKTVRAAWSATAEEIPIPSLYKPGWSEPRLRLSHETHVDGRLVHDLPWAATRSFTVSSRVATVPLGAAISVLGWATTAVLGTVTGATAAAVSAVKDAIHHEHRSDLAAHRGFVKGYTVAALVVTGAAWIVSLPAFAVGAVVGGVGAALMTGPVRLSGALVDKNHERLLRRAAAKAPAALEAYSAPAEITEVTA